jgi:hypothetical protein
MGQKNIVKVSEVIYRFNAIPTRPTIFFKDVEKSYSSHESTKTPNSQSNLNKSNKATSITTANFKIYFEL